VSGLVTAGGIVGAIASHALARPVPGSTRRASMAAPARAGRAEVTLSPLSLALAATGVRGAHSLLSLRF
jgi:hypothetical protein